MNEYGKNCDRKKQQSRKKNAGLLRRSANKRSANERRRSSRGKKRETSEDESAKTIGKNGRNSETSNENNDIRSVNVVIATVIPATEIMIVTVIATEKAAAGRGKKFPRMSRRNYQRRTMNA